MTNQKFKYVAVFELNGEKSALVFDSAKNAIDYMNMIIAEHDAAVRSVEQLGPGNYRIEFYGDVVIEASVFEIPAERVKYHLIRAENNQYIETRRFTNLMKVFSYVQNEFRKYRKLSFVFSVGLGIFRLKKKDFELKFFLSVVILDFEVKTREVVKPGKSSDEYYEVLEIQRGANEEEIKKAYRTKSKKVHPDFGGSAEALKKVNDAYRKLMEEVKNGGEKVMEGESVEVVSEMVEVSEDYPCVDIAKLIKSSQSGWDFIKKALGF